jgi:hypothetical protein
VKTRVDALLRVEAARFSFRYACDECGHFDAGRARCSLGYPAAPRRGALESDPDLELCKEFELG